MTPNYLTMRRNYGLGARLAGLGEIFAVYFLINLAGRHIYALAGWPDGGRFLFPENGEPDFLAAAPWDALQIFMTFGLALVVSLLVARLRGRPIAPSYGLRFKPAGFWKLTGTGLLAGAAIYLPPNLLKVIDFYVTDLGPGSVFWQMTEDSDWDLGFWLDMAATSFLLVAILEEILTRGYMIGRLTENFRAGDAILIVATIFALAHGQYWQPNVLSIGQIAAIIYSSLILGVITVRTGSIWPAIIAHMIVNMPALYILKAVFCGVAFLSLLLFRGAVGGFLRDATRLFREHASASGLIVGAPAATILVFAVHEKLGPMIYWYGVIGALAATSLFFRSQWRREPADDN